MAERQPALILLKGHPGSGKTTLGRALARYLSWPLVDKDDSLNFLTVFHSTTSSVDVNELSYDIMFQYMETQLSVGVSAIVDCPLARKELYDRACSIAGKYHATVVLVECLPGDENMWKDRLENRGRCLQGTSQAHKPCNWEDLQSLLTRYDGSWKWTQQVQHVIPHHVVLDTTTCSTDQHLLTVVTYLQENQLIRKL